MPRFIALMIAAALGAVLGTALRPGILEILIVAAVLTGLCALVRSVRKNRKVTA